MLAGKVKCHRVAQLGARCRQPRLSIIVRIRLRVSEVVALVGAQ